MLTASALCFAINCHGTTATGYLTNLALCLCMVDKCWVRVRTTSEPPLLLKNKMKEKKKSPDQWLC